MDSTTKKMDIPIQSGVADAPMIWDIPAAQAASAPLSPWLRLVHRQRMASRSIDVPLRRLSDFEMLLVLEGEASLWIEPAHGSLRLPPGSLALIPPELPHIWGQTNNVHLALHFDLFAQPDIAPLANITVMRIGRMPRPVCEVMPLLRWAGFANRQTPIVQRLSDMTHWKQCLEALLILSAGRTSAALSLDAQLAVQERLIWAVRTWVDMVAPPSDDPLHRIQSLLRRIDPLQRNQIDELAQSARMSPAAFRAAFRAATGQSPAHWLEKRRVDLAAQRLLHTNLSVTAIAEEVGYPDPYHFSRVFKRIMRRSPRDYRQAQRIGAKTD
jgi:AraC-like DNA-binding protein